MAGAGPLAGLPFSLSLSESEEAAREAVRLPHQAPLPAGHHMFRGLSEQVGSRLPLRPAGHEARALQNPRLGKGGAIVYVAGEEDDLDEEDPDDDLHL